MLSSVLPLPAEDVALDGRVRAVPRRARRSAVTDLPPFPSSAMDGYAVRAGRHAGPASDRLARRRRPPRGRALSLPARRPRSRPAASCPTAPTPSSRSSGFGVEGDVVELAERGGAGRQRAPARPGRPCAARRGWRRRHRTRAPRRSARSPPPASRECAVGRRPARCDRHDRKRAPRPGFAARARRDLRVERPHARGAPAGRGRRDRAARDRRRRRDAHRAVLERALEADVVVTSGGVSVGPHDLVRGHARAARRRGACSGGSRCAPASRSRSAGAGRTLVFGLPGNPVASLVGGVAARRAGAPAPAGRGVARGRAVAGAARRARCERNAARDDLLRGVLVREGDALVFTPVDGQESHMIVRASRANAIGRIRRGEGACPRRLDRGRLPALAPRARSGPASTAPSWAAAAAQTRKARVWSHGNGPGRSRARRRRARSADAEVELRGEDDRGRRRRDEAGAEERGRGPSAARLAELRQPEPGEDRRGEEDERVGVRERRRTIAARRGDETGELSGQLLLGRHGPPRQQAHARDEPARGRRRRREGRARRTGQVATSGRSVETRDPARSCAKTPASDATSTAAPTKSQKPSRRRSGRGTRARCGHAPPPEAHVRGRRARRRTGRGARRAGAGATSPGSRGRRGRRNRGSTAAEPRRLVERRERRLGARHRGARYAPARMPAGSSVPAARRPRPARCRSGQRRRRAPRRHACSPYPKRSPSPTSCSRTPGPPRLPARAASRPARSIVRTSEGAGDLPPSAADAYDPRPARAREAVEDDRGDDRRAAGVTGRSGARPRPPYAPASVETNTSVCSGATPAAPARPGRTARASSIRAAVPEALSFAPATSRRVVSMGDDRRSPRSTGRGSTVTRFCSATVPRPGDLLVPAVDASRGARRAPSCSPVPASGRGRRTGVPGHPRRVVAGEVARQPRCRGAVERRAAASTAAAGPAARS